MFPFIAARRSPNTDPVVVPAFLFGPFRRSWRSPSCDSLVSFRSSRPYFGVKYRALSYKNVSSGKTLASAFGRAYSLATFAGGHILWEYVFPEDKPKTLSSGKTHSHWDVFCRRTPTMWMCPPGRHFAFPFLSPIKKRIFLSKTPVGVFRGDTFLWKRALSSYFRRTRRKNEGLSSGGLLGHHMFAVHVGLHLSVTVYLG